MATEATRRSLAVRRARRGGALLETAFVLWIFLLLSFGTIEFGYFFFVKNALVGASREGCRAGIVPLPSGTSTAVQSMVISYLYNAGMNSSSATLDSKWTLTISPADVGTASAGTSVKVTVASTWGQVGQGFRPMGLIDSGKTIQGISTMRKEQ